MDHINGDWRDNRKDNLRFLCPNCHSQQKIMKGRKHLVRLPSCLLGEASSILVAPVKTCPVCGKEFRHKMEKTKFCSPACSSKHFRRCEWPSKDELSKLIWEKPTSTIAKDFGVSDSAVAKWCRHYGIDKPKRGYWAKVKPFK